MFVLMGTIVNSIGIIVGSIVGLLIGKKIPEKISKTIDIGVALCVLYIGISGSLVGEKTIIAILSMVIGAIIGSILDLDKQINKLGSFVEKRFNKDNNKETSISEGFVTSTMLFCVGAMTIVGSLQSGLTLNHETLYAKSLLDTIVAVIFASTMGYGVALSAICVFISQGTLTLLALFIAPYLGDTVVNEMVCVGSIILIGLALNLLKITNIKIMNLVPAAFIPIILCLFI